MNRVVQKAVVPAAGKGSRLLPATKSQPKEMLPVGRKPVIQYVVEELAHADIRNVLIITGRKKRSIEDHFDEDADWGDLEDELLPSAARLGVQVFYVRQSQPLGLGMPFRSPKSSLEVSLSSFPSETQSFGHRDPGRSSKG